VAKQRSGLGKGLDALIPGASEVITPHQAFSRASVETAAPVPVDHLVPIDHIIPNPRQPRLSLREDDPRLLELSSSIKEHGLIQPIVVTRLNVKDEPAARKIANDWFGLDSTDAVVSQVPTVEFQIIAGERRWHAARLAGLEKVPVVIKDVSPQQMLELALIENIQRADLNPIEEALAYQALIQEFGLTQEQVAKQVGKERSTISNTLRLLQLAARVREALINQLESFTEGHARPLIGIASEETQVEAMNQIIAMRLNVRQTEALAERLKAAENNTVATQSATSKRAPDIEELEARFRNALTVKVDLKQNARGKGTLALHFNNKDELERLYLQQGTKGKGSLVLTFNNQEELELLYQQLVKQSEAEEGD
jgi:ParB family chromosome partitioning protein